MSHFLQEWSEDRLFLRSSTPFSFDQSTLDVPLTHHHHHRRRCLLRLNQIPMILRFLSVRFLIPMSFRHKNLIRVWRKNQIFVSLFLNWVLVQCNRRQTRLETTDPRFRTLVR
ncbi:hypothetical protein HanRHA438_Chr08g0331481 [Helianthus annuus]|nr:hypothetical protein HanRHA438_Chr08g0331481 [Helianthus annuus]